MTKVENAVQWIIGIANDDTHGYSQQVRWGNPDYDCSSLVISAFEQAGIPVKTGGATYTGNMRSVFLKNGFSKVTDGSLKRGDVLLNELHHTALFIGNGQMVEARNSENGGIYGTGGDQTGKEIMISDYRSGWYDMVLRYTAEEITDEECAAAEECIPVGDEECADCLIPFMQDEESTGTHLIVPEYGDSGELVRAFQALLIFRGCSMPKYGADGEYGDETEAAYTKFGKSDDVWERMVNGNS